MKRSLWKIQRITILFCWGLLLAQAEGQTVRTSDYRINDENYATDAAWQQLSDIASSDGGFTVVWQETGPDFRTDIMARLFDKTGTAIGGKFRINEDSTMETMFSTPRVARHFPDGVIGTATGSFVVVWNDLEPGMPGGTVFGQIHENDGDRIGANFSLDTTSAGAQYEPAVAMGPSGPGDRGSFVVAWADRRDYSDIYARTFNGSGMPGGASFRVNADTSLLSRGRPAIALGGPLNRFVIVWEESDGYVYGLRRLMGQRFKSDGTPIGSSFRVDTLVPNGFAPSVAMAGDGSFVVAYETVINGQQDVYVQRFTVDGVHNGDPVHVGGIEGQNQRGPDIAMLAGRDAYGHGFIVAWDDVPQLEPSGDIYIRSFDGRNHPLEPATIVNTPSGTNQGSPALAVTGYGNVNPPPTRAFVVWQDDRERNFDIWGELFDSMIPNGNNFRINDADVGGAAQRRSALDVTPSGMQVVVWEDERDPVAGRQIYGKRLSSDGSPLGADFRISDGMNALMNLNPDVALFPDSSYVVVWSSTERSPGGDIYMQRFDGANNRIGGAITINDTTVGGADAPAVVGSAGGTCVVWRDYREDGAPHIYAQRFDAAGNRAGSAFRIDTDTSGSPHDAPAIAMFPDGSVLIVWGDERNGDRDIWAQEYDASGNRIGSNFRVNTSMPNENNVQMSPAVAISPAGEAMIAWLDYRRGFWHGDIFAQRYGYGEAIGGNFQVNDRDTSARHLCLECMEEPPSVAAAKPAEQTGGDNTFVIAWTDYRNGNDDPDVFAQLYNDNSPAGSNLPVMDAPRGTRQQHPDVARDGSGNNSIFFAWDDDRLISSEGWSIWGKIWEWTAGSSRVDEEMVSKAEIIGLHPNPFSGRTTFTFTLHKPGPATLKVYTAGGAEAASIIDEQLDAGEHSVQWDGSELSTGVYFYRLTTGTASATGTFVLMR